MFHLFKAEKINYLIYWLQKIFTYLDKFFTKYFYKQSLPQNGIDLYKNYFFIPLENNIYKEVNNLIKNDRNINNELEDRIKTILKIISYLDSSSSEIKKEKNNYIWIVKGTENKDLKELKDRWSSIGLK